MKRVFRFKKGELTMSDDDIIEFLQGEYLVEEKITGSMSQEVWRKNWKVTIIIEGDD